MRIPKVALTALAASLISSTPIYSATARSEAVDLMTDAQRDYKAGRFADALTKMKAADATPEILPSQVARVVHMTIVKYAVAANDYPSAVSELQKMIAADGFSAKMILSRSRPRARPLTM